MTEQSGRWQPPRKQPVVLVMKARGISQRQLAIALSYSDTYVSLAHRGMIRTSPRYRAAVAQYLALPESLLFHDVNDKSHITAQSEPVPPPPELSAVPEPGRRRGMYLPRPS